MSDITAAEEIERKITEAIHDSELTLHETIGVAIAHLAALCNQHVGTNKTVGLLAISITSILNPLYVLSATTSGKREQCTDEVKAIITRAIELNTPRYGKI